MALGVGIVGLSATAGWAAGSHAPALEAVDGLELRAVMASTPESSRAAAEAFGVTAHTSIADLARDDAVDLVVVAVKVPLHRELLLPALAAGVPVMSEWPLGVGLEQARELERAADGIPTFVGLQGRTLPVFRRLAALVAEGRIGELLSATVVGATTGWGAETSRRARYTLDRDNGATPLTIAFGHAIDAVLSVVGEPTDVVATTATRRPQVLDADAGERVAMTAEDQVAVSATLPNGAVLSAHYRAGTIEPGFSLVLDGTEGRLEVSAPNHPHITPVDVRLTPRGGTPETLPVADGSPTLAMIADYEAIRDDLRHGTRTAPDFAHAVRRHELLDAIQRAAADGRRVAL